VPVDVRQERCRQATEARHAGAIGYLYGLPATLGAFDTPLTKVQVLAIAGPRIGMK
jgi:hypothetical protein